MRALSMLRPRWQLLSRRGPAIEFRCMASKPRKEENIYSNTVNLPKTSFDMRANSTVKEPQLQAFWKENSVYETLSRENTGDVFTLHDGPPYANGELHMGHALNKILKDFINRYQLLKGRKAIYVPGWDTHGLPIELKAVESIATATGGPSEQEQELNPLKIRAKCRKFALKTIDSQRKGFQRMGVWGDWESPYITLNPEYEAAQLGVFGKMFLDGHIYRGLKPVHWSPSTKTALAEAELEYPDGHVSTSCFVSLALTSVGAHAEQYADALQGAELLVWTTTPWTLPANRAAAVHPDLDYVILEAAQVAQNGPKPRYVCASALAENLMQRLPALSAGAITLCTLPGRALVGATYASPLSQGAGVDEEDSLRRPILEAPDLVTADTGTGIVHMAPGHGHEDFALTTAAGIKVFSPVDEAGRYDSEVGPDLAGLSVLGEGQERVLEILGNNGRLIYTEPYAHRYPYDWRSKQPIIIRCTRQWFASVSDIREDALKALEQVRFVPGTGRNRIASMIAGRADWCISRQRVWGVPIPAFFYKDTGEPLMDQATLQHITSIVAVEGSDAWWRKSIGELLPERYRELAPLLVKGSDTMDVWFDSGTSWASVLCTTTTEEESQNAPRSSNSNYATTKSSSSLSTPRFPADLYLEGSDQHRGWFQSSLLTALAATGQAPYRIVLTHGFLLDERGCKMSKSLGNVVDPRVVMLGGRDQKSEPAFGADVLRLWVASVDYTADAPVGPSIVAQVSDVYRKLRFTLRYLLGNLDGFDPATNEVPYHALAITDRYLLGRLAVLVDECERAYDAYQFSRVYQNLQRFCVTDLSNFYLDACKDRLYVLARESPERRAAQTAMAHVLCRLLPLVAPLAPHLAEDAWQALPWKETETKSVFLKGWQVVPPEWRQDLPKDKTGAMQALLTIRTELNSLLEKARVARMLGSSLEAAADVFVSEPTLRATLRVLQAADNGQDTIQNACIISQATLVDDESELLRHGEGEGNVDTPLLVAQAELVAGDESRGTITVRLRRAKGTKCARCWNYSESVGTDAVHPQLCHRCLPVVAQAGV